ncbi:ATP-dependent DNA ligase [bacterium]|nr:ATP-dependent DNA ligase [bacterium]
MHQASFKTFRNLLTALDQCNATKKKIKLISEFIKDIDPKDGSWTLILLMGSRQKRLITGRRLREILQTTSKMPAWLIEDCFTQVGDSAETISLLWPQLKKVLKARSFDCDEEHKQIFYDLKVSKPLHWWMETLLPAIKNSTETTQNDLILKLWNEIEDQDHYVTNKLITGGFRNGVSKGIVVKSIAQAYEIDESTVLERLMKPIEINKSWFQTLTQPVKVNRTDRGAIPYPFYLASPVEIERIKQTPTTDWRLEYKWDGIRGQLIKRETGAYLWSRGEELVNHVFPEIIGMASNLPNDTVLDGEILCWQKDIGRPMPFASLQRRLGRKTVSKKLMEECPTIFMAYDILEHNTIDLRTCNLEGRVHLLQRLEDKVNHPCLIIDNEKIFVDWNELDNIRDQARLDGAEGLMIKKNDSFYLSGRKKGYWWKYKHDQMILDAVLIYAQAGTGKRANLFTDYTFALWDDSNKKSQDRKLVTFAKAYSGLNNAEIMELDRWIRSHTIERFGPTRVVEQKQVFEIAFEGVMESKRHKCGLAVRFPRIHRWRVDKPAMEADCIEQAQTMLKQNEY